MLVCVLFVSSRSRIVFNLSTGAIIDHGQSAKDIDPYFKSKLYVKDPSHRKPVPILSNDRSIPGESARDTKCYFCHRVDPNLLMDSPACSHRAITAL